MTCRMALVVVLFDLVIVPGIFVKAAASRPAADRADTPDASKAPETWVREAEDWIAILRIAVPRQPDKGAATTRPHGSELIDVRMVREGLMKLWHATKYPDPIIRFSYGELANNADEVLSAYEQWLDKNRGKTRGELAIGLVQRNIDAMDGPYTWPALCAVRDLVATSPSIVIGGKNGKYLKVTRATQVEVHRAMADWYRRVMPDLDWQPELGKLHNRQGGGVRLPEFELETVAGPQD